MAGDMKAEAVECGARAIWTRYTTSKICKEDHRDIPWTTLVRWGAERPLIQDLVNTAREESAVALNEWVALLSERGWQIVPVAATEEMLKAGFGQFLPWGTSIQLWHDQLAAAPSPFPEETKDV